MMRQYHEVKRQYPDMLVFFRMGDFYEMFYEDAVTASRELELTLTSRNNDKKGQPIPMAGVPHHAKDTYLNRLVKKGFKVVLCEQVEDPKQAKGLVRREVTQVVTPGTAVEEGLLESQWNNFLAAVHRADGCWGAGFLDISTGEFIACRFDGTEAVANLAQELHAFGPAELLVGEECRSMIEQTLPENTQQCVITTQPNWHFNRDLAQRALIEHFGVSTLEGFGLTPDSPAVAAAGALILYIKQTRKSALQHITGLKTLDGSSSLRLDETTVGNLELVRSSDGGKRWTLLSAIDFTRTGMGARSLRGRLLRPSLDLKVIEPRLDAVEQLTKSTAGSAEVEGVLKGIQDLERLLSRITTDTAGPKTLLALRASLQRLPQLNRALAPFSAGLLRPLEDCLRDVCELLQEAIDEEAPNLLSDGGVIRPGHNAELDEYRLISRSGKDIIAALESEERKRSGIANLKVKYNRVFGYFIEVTKSNLASVPEHYTRKQTLVNCERFITPELKEHEDRVLGAEEKILQLERQLFQEVRGKVAEQARRIQNAARWVAEIDVASSSAQAARKHDCRRPQLDSSQRIDIRGGRHPVLELQDGEPFVPNDLLIDTGDNQLLVLTGPNMGGKSTYLRQNALIVILAQMGSFVPAQSAHIGLVDRIYTRVGASDNLSRGRSTFMVEMIETANILNTATSRSLVLLDEVGRGTATFDGLSIAWSVAEYLTSDRGPRPRTIFATHYQELTKLDRLYSGVRNRCVAVRESGGRIIFFHKVMEGIADRSYGIEVARLAGLPQPVLERAREILSRLERKDMDLSGTVRKRRSEKVVDELQKSLF